MGVKVMSDNHEYVAITHLMTSRQWVNESAWVRTYCERQYTYTECTPYVWFKNLLHRVKVMTGVKVMSHNHEDVADWASACGSR